MHRVLALRGGSVLQDGGVVEADVAFTDRVMGVGADIAADESIDITGGTVIPGLIDAHVHLLSGPRSQLKALQTPLSLRFFEAIPVLREALHGGATYVRDASGADAGVRAAVDEGIIEGPKLKVAIRMIHTTGGAGDGYVASGMATRPFPPYPGSPDTVIDGPLEARNMARQIIRSGADVIKVAVTGASFAGRHPSAFQLKMREDELAEIVAEAQSSGIPVMAHAHSAEGAAMASKAGVSSVEHGTHIDREAAQLMAKNRTFLVPTLLASATLRARDSAQYSRLFERHIAALGLAIGAGVPIAAGSDAGMSAHGKILAELDAMCAAGLDKFSAIAAATTGGARLLDLGDHYGCIRPGSVADLLVIQGDLASGSLEGRLRQVWQRGVLRYRA